MQILKVGQHIEAWVNHECAECGHEHFASRCNPAVVTESDLFCSTCLDAKENAEVSDGLIEQLAAAKAEIAELKSGIEYAIDNFAYYTKKTGKLLSYKQQELEVKHLMDVLAKHKGE